MYAEVPTDGSVRSSAPRVVKLLSEDPANYPNAPREGIRRVLEEVTGVPHPRDAPLDASRIEWIRMGTTVATNALLEREGSRVALVTTRGFGDLLEIGNQARPAIFDLRVRKPPPLYEAVVEVDERVRLLARGGVAGGADESVELGLAQDAPAGSRERRGSRSFVMGSSGEWVEVLRPLDVRAVEAQLRALRDRGVDGVAIAFAHSYAFGEHEDAVGDLARDLGFGQVSASSRLLPMVRLVPRGQTACVDAYLTPKIERYISSFTAGFAPGTLDLGGGGANSDGGGGGGANSGGGAARVCFMQSDGGLTAAAKFSGFRAVLSGPAGGVVGYARTTQRVLGRADVPVIGFDMGGTSTDVSRYAGEYEHVFETETAGVKILCPQLDINTVAAGGGSRLFFRTGVLAVGPESAKAHPGPVCYRKGGHLAITDANLYLGRLLPAHFPRIFGPKEDKPLDTAAAAAAIEAIAADISAHREARARADGAPPPARMSPEEAASGFIRVANEAMCRPIRELSEARGFDPSHHALACFGGAGAQHVCAIARALGIRTAVVHAYAGILSAYGMGLADTVAERQAPCALVYGAAVTAALENKFAALEAAASEALVAQGVGAAAVRLERYLNLRYDGTDNAIMVRAPADGDYAAAMRAAFVREYGFELSDGRQLLVDDARVRAVSSPSVLQRRPVGRAAAGAPPPAPRETARVYFDERGWVEAAPVHELGELLCGHAVVGPAIVINGTSTCVVEPDCVAHVTDEGDLRIEIGERRQASEHEAAAAAAAAARADPIQLSVFSNRFMSIAEQMGRTLQRTATSVNIKERLDFSCAIFGGDGGLVANAPHVPVHLGAMADTVRAQVEKTRAYLAAGDVIVANDPNSGGSHLPDITVITPVFPEGSVRGDGATPTFYCASRGHHSDVGGSTPGSMPADSTALVEEGAVIDAFLLVKDGVFDEEGIAELLRSPARAQPPVDKPSTVLSGCRNMSDVLSDLKAQVAANAKGIGLLHELMRAYTPPVVLAYMGHVQANAAECVREMLREHARGMIADGAADAGAADADGGTIVVRASDAMDDGNPIALRMSIDVAAGTVEFDFGGTGAQVYGNWNAPTAVTTAAVIYSLRLLVGREIPLNSGCLEPVSIRIPRGSMLSPSADAAVCAGNVLTSQRITDVVLRAFGACAASQGCMNNLTFGDGRFGYYETIAGGSGGGPGWHGTSAVQCHMTNTRMTDVEILEKRYPVLLRAFGVRRGSGGDGEWRGGDGIVRELTFLRDGIIASLLTERRTIAPYGLAGGGSGACGRNTLLRRGGAEAADGEDADQTPIALTAKCKFTVRRGDTLRIETPGGGAYGAPAADANGGGGGGPGHARGRKRKADDADKVPGGRSATASVALSSNAVEF